MRTCLRRIKGDPEAQRWHVAPWPLLASLETVVKWEDFVERNNNELAATWGNLANARGYSGSC